MGQTNSADVTTLTERRLAAALAAGDERAFEELVRRHHRAIVRLVRAYVRTEAVAEEVAQETWAAVVRGIGRFEGRSSLKTWIMRIAVNQARTLAEREARSLPFAALALTDGDHERELGLEDRFGADGRWSAPPEPWLDPERRLVSLELREELRAAFDELPERQRVVVSLRDVDGLRSEEVCDLLGLTEANQRVLLHRGRTHLREALSDALGAIPA